MGQPYTLTFVNNSVNFASACVYATQPNLAVQDVMSLAWFAELANPTTSVTFSWTLDYSFVWDETGPLVPGITFNAAQNWNVPDLSTGNQLTLTNNGAFTFTNQQNGPQPGNLYIQQDGTIPLGVASVGIGMSGSGCFVYPAQPNQLIVLTPTPTYWITFGNYEQGQVLDVEQITNSAMVQYPANIYDMTATLSSQNLWTVTPTM